MTVLWQEDGDDVWEQAVKNDIHSLYPICSEGIDNVVGILDAEKYLRLSDRSRAAVMAAAVTAPHFAAQVMKADDLFREMKHGHFTISIVVDEYGGTYGLVTLNDLIERIVGDLEENNAQHTVIPHGNGYLIAGQCDRDTFDELFDMETDGDFATVGGWVMEKLEKIPQPGDTLTGRGLHIEVTKADGKRVLEIYAEKVDPVLREQTEEEKEPLEN